MNFLRKRLFLLLVVLFIYSAFFFTHLPNNIKQDVLGVDTNLALFEEPQDGKSPLLQAIASSTKEVDVEVYLLSDKDIIASLVAAHQRGVNVKVLLEQHPFGGGNINPKTKQVLDSSGIAAGWTNPSFALTHEKTIVIDQQEVFILNQNLTAASFTKNREYDIFDTNTDDVSEIKKIFDADWNRQSFTPTDENLVISPDTSRDTLTALLSSSLQEADIEVEVIDDPDIIHLLEQKAKTVVVHIILPSFSQVAANKKVALALLESGVVVKTLSSPYIHAKLILTDNKKAYIGSVNLTTQSMDKNREVGIILSQQDIMSALSNDFSTDWESATTVSP